MNSLERRINKVEKAAGGLPCKRHDRFFFFFFESDTGQLSQDDQQYLSEIERCSKCKDKLKIFFRSSWALGSDWWERYRTQMTTPPITEQCRGNPDQLGGAILGPGLSIEFTKMVEPVSDETNKPFTYDDLE